MTIRYFRFTSIAAVTAGRQYLADRELMLQQANAMAREFGGKALYRNNPHGQHFAGLTFDPPRDTKLWTHPTRMERMLQRPRGTGTVKAEHREALADLRQHWNALLPTVSASIDAVWIACGTDWGCMLFNQGGSYLVKPDAVYIAAHQDLRFSGDEITGGEFAQAVVS